MTAPTDIGPVTLPVPPQWLRIDSSDDVVVMAAPAREDEHLRPDIVLTTRPAHGPLHVVAARAATSVPASQPGAQVFGVEPDDLAEVLGVPSRTIEWGYEADRATVLVRQWIAVIGRHEVHVTGRCAVEDFEDFVPLFRSVLAAASITADDAAPSTVAPACGHVADDEATSAPIDVGASERTGKALEALDGLALAQPRPAGRWLLSDDALQHLWSIRERGMVSRARRRSPAGVELHEAGLTGAFGALADDGQRIAGFLERPGSRYGASAQHGGRSADWSMWLKGGSALVRAKGNVADLVDDRIRAEEVAEYDHVPAGRAVGRLLAWARVSPAWALWSDEEIVLPAETIDARIERPGTPSEPSPIAGFVADRLWREPVWVRLRVWGDRTPFGLDVVAAGGAGWFRRDSLEDGRVRLEPIPSGTVLRSVLAVFADLSAC